MLRPSFFLRGFLRPRDLAGISLGRLEREVMEAIWRFGETSVRDLHARFQGKPAYTTLMTTLDRLHKKALLARRKDRRAFVYKARLTREELESGIAADLIDELLARNAGQPAPLLSCFVDAVSERDRQLLDELDRMVQTKQRQLKRGG